MKIDPKFQWWCLKPKGLEYFCFVMKQYGFSPEQLTLIINDNPD